MEKVELPPFLLNRVETDRYVRWLKGRAQAHYKRDDRRSHEGSTVARYVQLIHEAAVASNGLDYYMGQALDWSLIGTWSNEASKAECHAYKRKYDRMPRVDHERADAKSATFRICGWSNNDSKHAMTTDEFIQMARAVLEHAGWTVAPPGCPLPKIGTSTACCRSHRLRTG